jgi:tRNA threonylcarbamoyladenosine biosynthesis protein TsaE
MSQFVTENPQETEALGQKLATRLHGGETVAFTGGMGMGKTVFTRGLARGLGVQQGVASPTFTIMREYEGHLPIYHFDMYRIHGLNDLYSCGFFDYVDGDGILIIEWSENISDYLPPSTIFVHFEQGETDNQRRIQIEGAEL